jgi:hypothetical protein
MLKAISSAGMAAAMGPRHEIEQAGEQAERQRRRHADQPQPKSGQRPDDGHGDELPAQPHRQSAAAIAERLVGQRAPLLRDQQDQAAAIDRRLGGEIDGGGDHQQGRCQRPAERQGEAGQAGEVIGSGQGVGQPAELNVAKPSVERAPGGRQAVGEPFRLAAHLAAEGGEGGAEHRHDQQDRGGQRHPVRHFQMPSDRIGEGAKDGGDDHRAEHQHQQLAQLPQDHRQSRDAQDDDDPPHEAGLVGLP